MNYELAKKLKDAGFPMKKLAEYDMTQCPFVWGHFNYNGVSYIFPTLSELIEACGGKMDRLEAHDNSTIWVASSFRWQPNRIEVQGSTPEEAVARLWLALNKK